MNEMASGQTAANSQSLQQILDLFEQAVQHDPASSEAHFGAAVCLAAKIAEDVDGQPTETPMPPAPPAAPGKPEGSAGNGGTTPPSPPAPPALGNRTAGPAVGPNETGETPPVPPGPDEPKPIPRHRTLGLFWNIDNSLSSPNMLLHVLAPISDLRFGFAPYFGYPHDNAKRRLTMLEKLNTVVEHLAKVEADPDFKVTLPDADSNGKTVTVGLPEVYMFDAYVQSLRAKLALSLSYVRDSGSSWMPPVPMTAIGTGTGTSGGGVVSNSDPGGNGGGGGGSIGLPIEPFAAAMDKNHDGKLTPDEYLPPSPYLTLRDAKLLQTAKQAMLAVVDRERKGIEGVLARPADGSFLIPNVAAVQQALTAIRDKVLPIIEQAATGPFTIEIPRWDPPVSDPEWQKNQIPVNSDREDVVFASPATTGVSGGGSGAFPWVVRTETLKVNIAAWFANPPADLKTLAPTLTLGSDGWPDSTKSVYPDKTFAGLFPDGIKDELPF